jgi:PleD family two-component response regulator
MVVGYPETAMATVLIAQPPSDERTRLRMALQMAGHNVAEASSGNHAAAITRTVGPDVAVIEDELPDMHATEAVLLMRRIRGYEKLPAVIVLPECADNSEASKSETPLPDVAAIYGLCKPVTGGDIEAAVERALLEAGDAVRKIKLEQRREVWGDVSELQEMARSATPSKR